MISVRKTLAAATAAGLLAVAVPVTANAAVPSIPLPANPLQPNPNLCLPGIVDPGPFGPLGPYGPKGPYGPNGPLHNQPNPIGNAATCGGGITYLLRGGTLGSFVQGSLVP
ncbi:MAG: hypothetical protein QOH72_3254 [Solirubrobacteraceae bacterium]|jgi:hypothetical protein|nr:hypothetical protein [Solirubrobacteraceae bacterium]